MASTAGGTNGAPDWMGLLQWSLQYQDGTTETKHTPLTAEKREYLEKVFSEMVTNEPERLRVITNSLIQYVGENKLHVDQNLQHVFDSRSEAVGGGCGATVTEDDLEDLLDECEDIVSQIDMADALVSKYACLDYLFVILLNRRTAADSSNHNYDVRTRVAGILALLAQNNEKVQAAMFAASVNVGDGRRVTCTELLLRVYGELASPAAAAADEAQPKLRTQRLKLCSKVIYAISGLLSYVPFQQQLFAACTGDGFGLSQMLLHAVNADFLPLVLRVTVLGESLVGRYRGNREVAILAAAAAATGGASAAAPVSSVSGRVGEHEVKITLDGEGAAPYLSLEQVAAAAGDAITDDNLLLLASVLVPSSLRFINYSADVERRGDDADAATRVDLAECSLRLLLELSGSPRGLEILRAYGGEQQGGVAPTSSVLVDCLMDSVKRHQVATKLAEDPATAAEHAHINCEQLAAEMALLKKVLYNVLAAK